MRNDIKELYNKASQAHDEVMTKFLELEENLPAPDLEELVDWCYAFREMHLKFEALQQKSAKIKRQLEQTTCALYINLPESNVHRSRGKIQTDHCTGSPSVRQAAHVPKLKNDPEGYFALCKHMGVSQELAEKEMFRVHWPSFVDYISDLTSSGKPVPPGIDVNKMYPVFGVRIHKRKEVAE